MDNNFSYLTLDGFYKQAKKLRLEFDRRFDDPLKTTANRFVWDYWYVKDQFIHHRTPADHFFSPELFESFLERLIGWGQENLGCHGISPPWLSYYIEGSQQFTHVDAPHGPWAYVYSLTPSETYQFTGGRTFLNLSKKQVKTIEPDFNRLIVFDPRIPHGVSEVRGTQDPQEGRLVIHGWFVEPRPFVIGALNTNQVEKGLAKALVEIEGLIDSENAPSGMCAMRLNIAASGSVTQVRLVSSNLRSSEKLTLEIQKLLKDCRFAKAKTGSKITLPLVFK